MEETFDVHLTLTKDSPNSMNFMDTYVGLDKAWYKFETDEEGNVSLYANAEGFEHLARYFLKMARTGKAPGYHGHHSLELGKGLTEPYPELTISIVETPREPA